MNSCRWFLAMLLWYCFLLSLWLEGEQTLKYVVSVGPRAEKFNIVCNDHGRTHKCYFSVFDQKFPFRANLVKGNPNFQFKLKSVTKNNSNMPNPMVMFTFSVFWLELPLLGKLGPKNQNCKFKLKFGTYTNSNMQNSMALFIVSVLDRKHPFWANMVQKIKIVSLSWNLVPRLIRIWRIQWRCSLFLLYTANTLFEQIWSKKS